jgi:osmotically-inducible protein OsmY
MAYQGKSDFGRGERDEDFRGNRGNDEWSRSESGQQFGRGYEESRQPSYGQGQRSLGSEGYPQENFRERSGSESYRQKGFGGQGYGQPGGYSEEGGYDRERRPGAQTEGYRRYGESYGRGPEGMDRETGSYGGYGPGSPTYGGSYGRSQGVGGSWQQSGGTRGYGSEFGRGAADFGGRSSFGETQRPGESATRGRFTGRGPKGYTRSDERIREDVSDRLEQHGEIDATDIEVRVSNGEVTLEGTVEDRRTKRMAEDIIETCPGVKQVHNRIRIQGNGGEREKSSDKKSQSSGHPTSGQSGQRGSTGTSSSRSSGKS